MLRALKPLVFGLLGIACQTEERWPSEVQSITYLSTADNTQQPALFYAPPGDYPKPLLVGLHTWGYDYQQTDSVPYAQWCLARGWVFIHPNFRGPNNKPEATGSELAVQDVLSAVEYAKQRTSIDPARIYLIGASGGGHMALLLAGRAPQIWAGISSWVPVTDLQAWYEEGKSRGGRYLADISNSCGGAPENDNAAAAECRKRSPLTYLHNARQIPIDINTGIYDGHKGSVPISHSLRAFNVLVDEREQLSEEEIAYFVKEAKVPAQLQDGASYEPYGKKRILFRRQSGSAQITIFDGGHEIIHLPALHWLARQHQGQPIAP